MAEDDKGQVARGASNAMQSVKDALVPVPGLRSSEKPRTATDVTSIPDRAPSVAQSGIASLPKRMKEHFRLRGELASTWPAEQLMQFSNGYVSGFQDILSDLGYHDQSSQMAHLALAIRKGEINEANAMVEAL